MKKTYWVGSLPGTKSTSNRKAQYDEEGQLMAITLTKDEKILFNTGVRSMTVIYGQCINRFCKPADVHTVPEFNSSGTLVDALLGSRSITATECAPRREGVLCGKCKKGYSLTMYNAVSHVVQLLFFIEVAHQ